MQKIILVAVGVLIGASAGPFILEQFDRSENNMEMNHEMDGHTHADEPMHDHGGQAVVDVSPAPTVTLVAQADSKSGYNLRLETENFTFTPESVGGENVQGQGHAHVYVNDVKITRVYGDWVHLPAEVFKAGENRILVTLNANDHSQWHIANEPVQAEIMVTQ